eukprot:3744297-Amphidinium_carterae.1
MHILVTWLSGHSSHLVCEEVDGAYLCLLDTAANVLDTVPCQGMPEPTLQRALDSWLAAHGDGLTESSLAECQQYSMLMADACDLRGVA